MAEIYIFIIYIYIIYMYVLRIYFCSDTRSQRDVYDRPPFNVRDTPRRRLVHPSQQYVFTRAVPIDVANIIHDQKHNMIHSCQVAPP